MTKTKKKTYPTIEHIMKVTGFHTPTRAQGAIEALKWLENGAPHKLDGLKGKFHFNMSEFVSDEYEQDGENLWIENHCGTACCIAGAVYAFSKNMNGNKQKYGDRDMGKIFHLDDYDHTLSDKKKDDLNRLFFPPSGYDSIPWDEIQPKDAAKTLRRYLEDGVVMWEV